MALDDILSALGLPSAGGQTMGGASPMGRNITPYVPQEIEADNSQGTSGRRADHKRLLDWINHPNIARDLDDYDLGAIGQRVMRERQIDLDTTTGWRDESRVAMELAMQVRQAKQSPWPGASNIIFPLMTTAAIQFGARAYPAIIQGRNVVKGVVIGDDTGTPQLDPRTGQPVMMQGPQGPMPQWAVPPGTKRQRATRIGDHMSWQLLSQMSEWEEETDQMLVILPILGCCFRKTFFDTANMCNASMLVLPMDLIINYRARSMERAPRLSEEVWLYPNEIEESVRADLFIDHNYGQAEGANGDDDAPHLFTEQHRYLDLDDDGYAEPYIVTVHQATSRVARIVARYDADGVHITRSNGHIARIEPVHYYTKYDFIPNPERAIYGKGFGQLLAPINEAVNTTLNMLFDAGHLANTGGGFIGRGLSMHAGAVRFRPGEYKVVNAPGQTIRDAIVEKQWPGPSAVLFSLLGTLIDAGKEVASVKDVLEGQTNAASMQPTTLLALIEQGLKVFTAIYKRVHRSAKREYEKVYRLNRIYLPLTDKYQVGDEWRTISKDDYAKGAGVEPISDPNMVSDMQKAARTQFLMGFANDPMCNGMEIRREAMTNAMIENPERFLNTQPQGPNPALELEIAKATLDGHRTEQDIASKKTQQIRDYTQAVLNLANAEAALSKSNATQAETDIAWIEQHIDAYRAAMESLMQPANPPGQGGESGQASPPQIQGPQGFSGAPHPSGALPHIPLPQAPGSTDMSFHDAPFARPGPPPAGGSFGQ